MHRSILEREVEHVREAPVADERRQLHGVGRRDLAEDLEVLYANAVRSREDLRHPQPEEAGVHVARRVDTEPVEPVLLHPRRVDVSEAVDDDRLLREEIVEPEEVALLETLLV